MEFDRGESAVAAAEVKPWHSAKVEFRVLPLDSKTKNRREELRKMRVIGSEGINSTPYVPMKWEDGREAVVLFDTGSQWSLIRKELLTDEERMGLRNNRRLLGKGVSGEEIPVIGEVWRTVEVGGLAFKDQRFIVVKTMICPIILGIDFWSRLRQLSFDFNNHTVILNGNRKVTLMQYPEVQSKTTARTQSIEAKEDLRPVEVIVGKECCVPPYTEVMIECLIPRSVKGRDYMVQPICLEEQMVSTPYGIVKGSRDGWTQLRVANISKENEHLAVGQAIATVDESGWVANLRVDKGFKPRKDEANAADFENVIDNKLELNERVQLRDLLKKYSSIFYKGGRPPIVRVEIEHSIAIKESGTPVVFKPRRLSRELSDEVRKHVDELLDQGVIRESNSRWAAPIVCARKRDGSLRMAVDYRVTNEQSNTATLHLIPLIDDLLDRLGKANFFAILDAKSGYHQLPLRECDSEVTAFVVPWGHYEFAGRTPFGLKGAGYSFQRMMSVILGSCNFVDALCYLDDVLVWGETWGIFIKRLTKVFIRISEAGLALSLKNVSLEQER